MSGRLVVRSTPIGAIEGIETRGRQVDCLNPIGAIEGIE
jgi:hypothetical protein